MKVHTDYTKKEIIDVLEKIKSESNTFKSENENNLHAVKAVLVYWIGFSLNQDNHPFMDDFDIDEFNYPGTFQLTKFGKAINVSQYLLEIAEIDKTTTFLFQDDQPKTRNEPISKDYVDE